MYLGEIVESGTTNAVFEQPQHPYTQALLSSTPRPVPGYCRARILLTGAVPSVAEPPAGCRFHTRCPQVMDRCHTAAPALHGAAAGHAAACHLLE